MLNVKERQITHIKEVFKESGDSGNVAGAGGTDGQELRRCTPGHGDTTSSIVYLHMNGGTMTNDQRANTAANGSDGSHTKVGSKKKRPAPKPPELGRSLTDGESRGGVGPVHVTAAAAVGGTEGRTCPLVPETHLSPTHTSSQRLTGGGHTVTQQQPVILNGGGHRGEHSGGLTDTPSMSQELDKENRGITRGGGVPEAESSSLYPRTAGSVCQSDTGTIASSGYHSDIMKDTGSALADLDPDNFEECGFTVEFEDEDEGVLVESRHTHVYKEFEGEDFSQYLEDDQGLDEPHPVPPPREGKKQKGTRTPLTPAGTVSAPPPEERTLPKKNGFKQRFSKVFTMSRSQNKNATTRSQTGKDNSIHNFTFSDSKLGNQHVEGEEINDPGYRKSQAYDTLSRSDLGAGSQGSAHWWNTGTLSARNERSGGMSKHRSNSVPNMLDEEDFFYNSGGGRGGKGPSSVYSEHTGTTSSRKSGMYESKGQGSQAKKSNIWKKFSRTLKRERKPDVYTDNRDVSTLSVTHNNPEYQDVRL